MCHSSVLGIDPSLNGTGLCVLSDQGRVLHLETVHPGDRRGPARLSYVKSRVEALLAPDLAHVAIEGYAYAATGRVFYLGEVGGVLRLLAFERGLPISVVAPTSLKRFATGRARAEKVDMIDAARAEGVQVGDDNQADAYFLARLAWHRATGAPAETRARMEVLRGLAEPRARTTKRRWRQRIPNAL